MAVDRLRAFIGRGQERVPGTDGDRCNLPVRIDLETLSTRLPKVPEKAETSLFGCDKQDVVVVVCAEYSSGPVDASVRTTSSGFPGSSHHLIQRGITCHRIRQLARRFRVRTPELDGG